MKIDYKHDTRKEPKKLQKERTKEEGVSPISPLPFVSHHPFSKKDFYNVLAPTVFDNRVCTLTPATKTQGKSKCSLLL